MNLSLVHLASDPVALSLARWQFGLTTLYHYLFVPLTIGMMLLVAILQSTWVRTGKVKYLQLTKLFGKIFLINFAMGVVTGIVQEFQFGMNWSEYSRFVGDIFGAPLAMEGLFAFFLEATFIGVWIFGWNRIPRGAHLASAWLVSIATILSGYFIITANSFMQNPVGYHMSAANGRAQLTNIGTVLTNPVGMSAFPHAITAAVMFAAGVIMATAAYHLVRNQHVESMRTALKFGSWSMIVGFAATFFTGDQLGLAMVKAQPMKMAAAEALYNTTTSASFSLFTWPTDHAQGAPGIRFPYLLSFLSTHTFTGKVEGLNDLNREYAARFCGNGAQATAISCPDGQIFNPTVWATYSSFRLMIAFGALSTLLAVVLLFLLRRSSKIAVPAWLWKTTIWFAGVPLIANLLGWTFTEIGRQPWIVFSLMTTKSGVSPNVPSWTVGLSLAGFTVVYGVLAVIEFGLITRAAKAGPEEFGDTVDDQQVDPAKLAITY